MRLLTTITFLILTAISYASDIDSMYHIIKHVETDNRPNIVGDGGKAFGALQIHKICVDDVNRMYGTNYSHSDALDTTCAKEIFKLYLQAGIRRYKRVYGDEPTEGQVVRMWNGGIYRGYRIKATDKYLRRYNLYKSYFRSKKGVIN